MIDAQAVNCIENQKVRYPIKKNSV